MSEISIEAREAAELAYPHQSGEWWLNIAEKTMQNQNLFSQACDMREKIAEKIQKAIDQATAALGGDRDHWQSEAMNMRKLAGIAVIERDAAHEKAVFAMKDCDLAQAEIAILRRANIDRACERDAAKAEIVAMREAVFGCIETLEGTSGGGASHWEQYPFYRKARGIYNRTSSDYANLVTVPRELAEQLKVYGNNVAALFKDQVLIDREELRGLRVIEKAFNDALKAAL